MKKQITKRLFTAALALGLLSSSQLFAATKIGFSTEQCGREYVFRIGSTEKQGIAIRLSGDKLQALKGCSISAVSAVFGSRWTVDGTATVFVSTSPDGTPLREKTATIATTASAWAEIKLDEPYTITGNEGELYIGYYGILTGTNTFLSADYSTDTKGCSYVYKDGAWVDMYGLGCGNANVMAVVENVPELTDAMVKDVSTSGYYTAGTAYSYGTQLFNFGTTEINSFDVVLRIGGETTTSNYAGLSIPPHSVYDIDIPPYSASSVGDVDISVEVANINGGSDATAADNVTSGTIFFYPAGMERNLLLEGFTGQECPNCPAGHRTINAFLASTDKPVVEVMHHSGYQPDRFSMDEDYDYTMFFGGSGTFAPAFMMNRTLFPLIQPQSGVPVPAMNTVANYLTYTADEAWNAQPYVSLKLESTYNPATREVNVKAMAYGHNDMPSEINVMNVMLVQDRLVGEQSGQGSGYIHDNVYRGSLMGNAWGKQLPDGFGKGGITEWNHTFTLPAAIYSDFWTDAMIAQMDKKYTKEELEIPTVPENMYIVAYVAAYKQDDFNGHNVYNCVKVKLGESHEQKGFATGISAPDADGVSAKVRVSGRSITVEGECDSYAVFDMSGRKVSADRLPGSGVYIVKVMAGGKSTASKVVVR